MPRDLYIKLRCIRYVDAPPGIDKPKVGDVLNAKVPRVSDSDEIQVKQVIFKMDSIFDYFRAEGMFYWDYEEDKK